MNSTPEGSPLHEDLRITKLLCEKTTDLEKVSVPKNRHGSAEKFDLFYEKRAGKDPRAPTVIYLPGGPGGSSIGDEGDAFDGQNAILTDPRGTGCNFGNQDDFRWSDVSTDEAATDVVEIVKKENLKSFVIYGLSYGTVLGTVVTAKLEAAGLSPQVVILDGILGRSLGQWSSYVGNFVNIANTFLDKYPSEAQMFMGSSFPLDLSREFWASELSGVGNSWNNSLHQLQVLQNPNLPEYQMTTDQFRQAAESFSHGPVDMSHFAGFFVLQSVICSEISKDYFGAQWPVTITNDRLILTNQATDLCPAMPLPYSPYESAKYQIQAPIIYFQGETDPQTPMATAKHHYDGQKSSTKKVFITVAKAGHAPLGGPDLVQCSSAIWGEILKGGFDFSDQLDESGHCRNSRGLPDVKRIRVNPGYPFLPVAR